MLPESGRSLVSGFPRHAGEKGADSPHASVQSLAGLKVLVTRPRDQSLPLAHGIELLGGVPLLFPLLDIAPVPDDGVLQEQVSRLALCDLAIFISPNAVHYGMAAIRAAGGLPDTLKIATVGAGSAKALHAAGISEVIVPTERFDSEGLLALPQLQQIAGWRVMIFRGDGGRALLGDTLRARGAEVEYVVCYRRSKPQQPVSALLDTPPDVITVTSSEALGYLWQMLDAKTRLALSATPLFVPHARIAELARSQGWAQVHLTGAGDEGLLSALQDWANRKAMA